MPNAARTSAVPLPTRSFSSSRGTKRYHRYILPPFGEGVCTAIFTLQVKSNSVDTTHGILSRLINSFWILGIVVNASCDTTRPLLRLLTLIATVVAFAVLWSGDQKVQAEIAAARAKSRSVYAGPAVMQNQPMTPRHSSVPIVRNSPSFLLGFLDRIPSGHYQLVDDQGNTGTLVLHSHHDAAPVQRSMTIRSTHGEIQLTPLQIVSTAEMIYR